MVLMRGTFSGRETAIDANPLGPLVRKQYLTHIFGWMIQSIWAVADRYHDMNRAGFVVASNHTA